jgi:hypothetical protein
MVYLSLAAVLSERQLDELLVVVLGFQLQEQL